MLLESDKRLLWKLAWNMGFKGLLSVRAHKKRLRQGKFFPPYLYISIINSCNLRCQGCWVDVAAKQHKIEVDAMNRMINKAKEMGNSFFGILGGEPFMHKELFDVLEAHPDAYFQVFTNGHFITDAVAKRLRRCGNVTALVSVEGSEIISDERRGKAGVLSDTMRGIENCLNNKVMTGVCTSLCQTNFDDLLTEKWVDNLSKTRNSCSHPIERTAELLQLGASCRRRHLEQGLMVSRIHCNTLGRYESAAVSNFCLKKGRFFGAH